MIFAALVEAAGRGELLLVDSGLCRFHRRRDGTTTIREILVLPGASRRGVGRRLVESAGRGGGRLVARCPAGCESNGFWAAIGFRLGGTEGRLNVWVRD